MLKRLIVNWAAVLAGAAVAALVDAALHPAGIFLAAFTVALVGAMVVAVPAGLLLSLGPWAGAERASRGMLLAGLCCGSLPWLLGLLPLWVAAGLGLALAAVLAMKLTTPAWATRWSFVTLGAALLLMVVAIYQGGQGSRVIKTYALPERADAAGEGPDVVLISIDTMRADDIVGPRPEGYELPTLDRLRAEGIWADYGIANSNQTLPAHVSMLSGLDPMEHGVRYNLDPVPPSLRWVSSDFREAGWHTAAVISNPLLSGDVGFGRDFEIYDDSGVPARGRPRAFAMQLREHALLLELLDLRRFLKLFDKALFRSDRQDRHDHGGSGLAGRGAKTNEQTLGHLDGLLAAERPYFLFLHYMDPHDPYRTVAPFDGSLTAGHEVEERFRTDHPAGIDSHLGDRMLEAALSEDPAESQAGWDAIRWMRDVYREEVAYTDWCIGQILERIAESGRPTVVLVTADHGEHFGEHGILRHGVGLYKENIDVPFIVWGEGVPQDVHLQHPPDLTDVGPTLLAYAGIRIPDTLGGRILGIDEDAPRVIVVADDDQLGVLLEEGKWVGDWGENMVAPLTPRHWFPAGGDRAELDDRLGEVPAEVQTLVQQIADRDVRTEQGIGGGVLDPFQLDLNKELGYVE